MAGNGQTIIDLDRKRMTAMAEKDARELLATQGYFAPQVRITRRPGTPPAIEVDVQPGERTVVSGVDLEFQGDIATSTDPDAASQREAIRNDWELPAGRPFTQYDWDHAKSTATRQLLDETGPIKLTSGEFAVLAALVTHPFETLSRERLIALARGRDHEAFDRSIDVMVSRLRRCLEDDPRQPRWLQTVWGEGYVFVPDGEKP